MSGRSQICLGWLLGAGFLLAMIMGTGPGVLLVNRPGTVLGIPVIYAWGILWYGVIVFIALLAVNFVLLSADDAEAGTDD